MSDPSAPKASPANPAWPTIDLRQVLRLTDDTGLFQHALYATPDPTHGYCIDDNARALIAALRLAELKRLGEPGDEALPVDTYLMFVTYALNEGPDGRRRFRNFMGYDRAWLEDVGSEDSQGRGLWALGESVRWGPTPNERDLARDVYEHALPGVSALNHARSWGFALMGVAAFLQAHPDHAESQRVFSTLAERLWAALQDHRQDGWLWWESIVTYDNAKLPHALLTAGSALGNIAMQDDALASLRWVLDRQTTTDAKTGEAHLSIIGNDGWLPRDGRRAAFDQQPLEAYALVDACLDAARLMNERGDQAQRQSWEASAWMCFGWFTGRNDLHAPVHDPVTGGCRDGLQPEGVNRNQGAESTLAYVLSVLELHRYDTQHPGRLTPLAADRPDSPA